MAAAEPPVIALDVIGGLAGVSQYDRYEAPFWTTVVPAITGGRVAPRIAPFDRTGLRGQELLQLLRLGVVSFANVILSIAAGDEPELNALDLPLLSPDAAGMRRVVTLWRPRLEETLLERHGVTVLAVYSHPAQVVFCNRAFAGLSDLTGRRVRTSSVGQSELLTALGAIPVVVPFAEMVSAMRSGVVECAVTGALSGNAIGLGSVATHQSRFGLGWGVSAFVANTDAWNALPEEVRRVLGEGLRDLEDRIWEAAASDTEQGLACNAGRPNCVSGQPGRMAVVELRREDEERRRSLLTEVILPNWIRRCGGTCAEAWNRLMAPSLGLRARGS